MFRHNVYIKGNVNFGRLSYKGGLQNGNPSYSKTTSSLEKAFRTNARNVFVVTELVPGIRTKRSYGDYSMLFTKTYEIDSVFAYHRLTEVWDHYANKKGRPLSPAEELEIRKTLTFEDEHIVIKNKAYVAKYWWQREMRREKRAPKISDNFGPH